MKHQFLTALAAGSLVALAWPQGDALAQSRAAAEAAMEQLGFANNTGMNGELTYGEASWSNGRYILSDVVMTFPADDTEEAEDSVDEGGKPRPDAEESNSFEVGDEFETAHLERMIFDAPRLDADGQAIFDGMAMEGMSAEEDGGADYMRVAYFGVSGINAEMALDLARALRGEAEDFEPDWSSWRFEDLRLEGVEMVTDDQGAESRIALDQFALHDNTDVELGQFIISGFRVESRGETSPVTVGLDEFSVTGFKTEAYADLMSVIAAGGDEDALMSAYYRSAMNPRMDLFDRFAIRGVLVEAEGVHFALDNLTAQVRQQGTRYITDMTMDSLRLVPDAAQQAGAQLAMALGMLGYERLEMTAETHGIYDEATGRMWTEGDNFLELQDGLRIEIGQNFSGYDAYFANLPEAMAQMEAAGDDEAMQTEASLELMRPIVLHNMSVSLVDMSLLERALEAGAAAQGITTDELRIQAGAMIGMGMMSAPPEIPRPLLSQLSTALTSFVNSGGTLTIDATPPEPVSFGTVFDQIDAGTFDYNMLGLTFTAEAP